MDAVGVLRKKLLISIPLFLLIPEIASAQSSTECVKGDWHQNFAKSPSGEESLREGFYTFGDGWFRVFSFAAQPMPSGFAAMGTYRVIADRVLLDTGPVIMTDRMPAPGFPGLRQAAMANSPEMSEWLIVSCDARRLILKDGGYLMNYIRSDSKTPTSKR